MVVIALAVGAALCNALASVLQRAAARSAPDEDSLRLQLVTYLLRRPAWFAGIVAMMGSFILQATALTKGSLSVVQPLLVTELLFVLAILAVWFRSPVRPSEWLGAVAIVLGLGGFLAVSAPVPGYATPGPIALGGAGLGTAAVIGGAISLSRRGTSIGRAALFGAAAGTAFGLTAAITKMFTTSIANDGFAAAFSSWPPYALAATGIGAVFLAQNAFQAGPLTASQPALTIADPLVSVALGVGMFHDHLRAAGWDVFLELFTFAVMALGIVLISRSPNFHSEVRRADQPPPARVVSGLGSTSAGAVAAGRAATTLESRERPQPGPARVSGPGWPLGPGSATGPNRPTQG